MSSRRRKSATPKNEGVEEKEANKERKVQQLAKVESGDRIDFSAYQSELKYGRDPPGLEKMVVPPKRRNAYNVWTACDARRGWPSVFVLLRPFQRGGVGRRRTVGTRR